MFFLASPALTCCVKDFWLDYMSAFSASRDQRDSLWGNLGCFYPATTPLVSTGMLEQTVNIVDQYLLVFYSILELFQNTITGYVGGTIRGKYGVL